VPDVNAYHAMIIACESGQIMSMFALIAQAEASSVLMYSIFRTGREAGRVFGDPDGPTVGQPVM